MHPSSCLHTFLYFSTHWVKQRHQVLLRNPVMASLLQTPVQTLIRILISSAPHCFPAPRRSRWALRLELRVYYTTRGGHNWLFFNRIITSGEYCRRAVLGAWGHRQLQRWSEVLNPLLWWSFLFKNAPTAWLWLCCQQYRPRTRNRCCIVFYHLYNYKWGMRGDTCVPALWGEEERDDKGPSSFLTSAFQFAVRSCFSFRELVEQPIIS